jgi:hypothetical protein
MAHRRAVCRFVGPVEPRKGSIRFAYRPRQYSPAANSFGDKIQSALFCASFSLSIKQSDGTISVLVDDSYDKELWLYWHHENFVIMALFLINDGLLFLGVQFFNTI